MYHERCNANCGKTVADSETGCTPEKLGEGSIRRKAENIKKVTQCKESGVVALDFFALFCRIKY